MARFAPLPYPGRPTPVAPRAVRHGTYAQATAIGAVLFLLAAIGSLAVRLAASVQQGLRAWAEQRRQRVEDRKLWELALTDSRVMADLVALSQHDPRGTGRFI